MPSQTGYFDSLISAAGKVFSFLATITITGTDGKTITCTQDTSLDEAVAMSSKAPKASPTFTGSVTAGDYIFGTAGVLKQALGSGIAAGGYLDITLATTGGASNFGILGIQAGNTGNYTQTMYAFMSRATTYTATPIGTKNIGTGKAFSLSMPSNGVVRITNDDAAATGIAVYFVGSYGA